MHDPDRAMNVLAHVPREDDLVALRRPVERAAAKRQGRRQDLLQTGAVHVDDEHSLVTVRAEAVEHDPLAIRRPTAGHVVAARIRGDLLKAPAVRGADQMNSVQASVLAEGLAEKQRPVRRWAPTRIEHVRILTAHVAKRAVVGIDDPRPAGACGCTTGRDVAAVGKPRRALPGVRRFLDKSLVRPIGIDDVHLCVAERRVEPGEGDLAVGTARPRPRDAGTYYKSDEHSAEEQLAHGDPPLGSIEALPIDARTSSAPAHRGGHETRSAASHNASPPPVCDDHDVRRTVLIVDDHEDFRRSASALLAAEGFEVVGAVADGGAVIEAVERLRPEVVLLDIQLPDLDGFAVAERLSRTPDPPHVVLISSRDEVSYGPRIGRAPARGFLAKRELSGASLAALVD